MVRGDIIILETGDVVPADLRLITAQDLTPGGRNVNERAGGNHGCVGFGAGVFRCGAFWILP